MAKALAIELHARMASRGLVHQVSHADIDARLSAAAGAGAGVSAYAGFDPTADSLHVGHLSGIIGLMHAQRAGLRAIALVGGATGLIGDPSGRSSERLLLSREQVEANVAGIAGLLGRFLSFGEGAARLVNNLDWFSGMSALDFLRDVGKHFRLGAMLSKDSVRSRMGWAESAGAGGPGSSGAGTEEGMSYTEFSYQLLQGYDFYRLYKDHGCRLQLGGSDQWGNITAGTDLIRRLEGESGEAFGLTWPLVTTASGQKFGKSEGNAVWLTAERTSVYEFHQFWLNVADAMVRPYLLRFTFLPVEQIDEALVEHGREPGRRVAQRQLADSVTELVHGRAAMEAAVAAGRLAFGEGLTRVEGPVVGQLRGQMPVVELSEAAWLAGAGLLDLMVQSGLARSKSEARRLVEQGGVRLGDEPVRDSTRTVVLEDFGGSAGLVLRKGKKDHALLVRSEAL